MIVRRHDRGMTVTEVMVVLVIVALLSAVATPMFRGDRVAREGREFAAQLARDMQRSRYQAVAERMPIRAFVFSDRVEFRSAVAGATPADPPRAAVLTDPLLRVLRARSNIRVYDVLGAAATPSQTLSTSTNKVVEFNALGQAQLVGSFTPGILLYVRNDNIGVSSVDRNFLISIAPLSGAVSLQEVW
jgi:prepilin-type N-terminal cleavage/methylation domain-containing protein